MKTMNYIIIHYYVIIENTNAHDKNIEFKYEMTFQPP